MTDYLISYKESYKFTQKSESQCTKKYLVKIVFNVSMSKHWTYDESNV